MFAAVWGESFTGREIAVIDFFQSRRAAQAAADQWMQDNPGDGYGAWVRLA